jgi:type IV pilus assembly protein PilM
MSKGHKTGGRPKLACEIASDRILAGRAADNGDMVAMCAGRELTPGIVMPDLTETNLPQREALRSVIETTLGGLGNGSRDVIAVLPDATVRVALLDFDTLPSDPKEAESVVRFRLKKSLPFDVEKARVSHHLQPGEGTVKVIAAVALASVMDEYEEVFREAGYSPGVVLPSTLAALGAMDAERPTLMVKVELRSTSVVILDKNQMVLFRTMENPQGPRISGEQLAEEVYPSVVFFQDNYQTNIEKIYVAGLPDSEGARLALRAQTGAEAEELVAPSAVGAGADSQAPRWRMAGIVGALLS